MKHQILGLLEVRNRRGLSGSAHEQWIETALDILLRAELKRIEQREKQDAGSQK
jgi:hypothetical protein